LQRQRVAGLLLIGRGYLPSRVDTFRFLLQFLVPENFDLVEDPLTQAEEEFKQFAGSPLHAIFDRIIRRNLALAQIVDPATMQGICIDGAASGLMTQIMAAMLGDQLPDGAAEEIAGAWGLIEPRLSANERCERINFVEAMFAGALTFKELASAASTVSPPQLQAIIIELRRVVAEHPIGGIELFADELLDIFLVMLGLAITIIDGLGGLAWFQSMGCFIESEN
jgi:hypothetical protein